ncbi:hypothetical protein KIN20_012585 [Parelaphostrongylus tenuis]|uniref:Uncharacterized protein n=1 Tax=Parelaphostrongylus tenuis TaxID=148309 RepID=A0AAD5MED1_PARTN|nr:hypothetical protein KIN20_012585 [Parelaphostrongylus tenuis]
MISVENIANVSSHLLLISLLTIMEVLGCGHFSGRARFDEDMEVQRYRLQSASCNDVLYCSRDAGTGPGISPSLGSAEALVKRLVTQGVIDVLEQQGRAAGLPDAIITTILSQLGVNVLYTPLQCHLVKISPAVAFEQVMMMRTCVIVGNTVTTTCPPAPIPAPRQPVMCMPMNGMNYMAIDPQHMSISGTLTTSNLIMATWSREMWQSVVNRVLRMITSDPFGTQFATAVATVT